MSGWTDKLKKEVINAYEEAEPNAENSSEIVASLAEEYEKTPNGVRLILSQAGVYIKKVASSSASTGSTGSTGKPKRASKADAIAELTVAIKDSDQEVSEEIIAKLTGKAAQYFTGIIRGIMASEG